MGFALEEDRPTPKEVYGWRPYGYAVIAALGAVSLTWLVFLPFVLAEV
jgi:hypothetical protein